MFDLISIPALTALAPIVFAQSADVSIGKATLSPSKPAVGSNLLELSLTDSAGKPVTGLKLSATVEMTSMNMGSTHPAVREIGGGKYQLRPTFSMEGPWRVSLSASDKVHLSLEFEAGSGKEWQMGGMPHQHEDSPMMDMGAMMGRFGDWTMSREGSGTSWLPDSSPMFMKMLPKIGGFDASLMGFISGNYTHAGGKRGDSQFFSSSMPMLMLSQKTGGGIFGLSFMGSLDPFNGKRGYPNLFQTGETADGLPLVDRQHPHDLVAEVAATYSHPIGGGLHGFVYGGPIGEPALGGPNFMHRPSGMEIPEAPISHHWFDSTHIAFGVATVGVNSKDWQVEGSVFNGHEPDENRFAPDPIQLNSASGRVTFNPSRNLSLQASYGYLNSPEATSPGVDEHRLTASAIYSLPMNGQDNLSLTAALGRDILSTGSSNSYLLEATYLHGPTSWFTRFENVGKDDLFGVPAGTYDINKLLVGGVHNVATKDGFEFGVGAYAGFYSFPSSLEPFYGKNPVTLGVFIRIRPRRMVHEMAMSRP